MDNQRLSVLCQFWSLVTQNHWQVTERYLQHSNGTEEEAVDFGQWGAYQNNFLGVNQKWVSAVLYKIQYLFAGYPKLAIMPMDFMVCMMMTSNYMDYTGMGISISKGGCFRTKQNMCDNVLQPANLGITAHLCHGDQHQGGAPVPMPSPSPRISSSGCGQPQRETDMR